MATLSELSYWHQKYLPVSSLNENTFLRLIRWHEKKSIRRNCISRLDIHSSLNGIPAYAFRLDWMLKFLTLDTFSDMRSLIQQLENSKYSTILYVFSNSSRIEDDNQQPAGESPRFGDFFGYCDIIASQLSSLYNKNIVFWPCPNMKVSVMTSWSKSNLVCSQISFRTESNFNWRKHRVETKKKPSGLSRFLSEKQN